MTALHIVHPDPDIAPVPAEQAAYRASPGWGATWKPAPPNHPPAVLPGVGSAMTFRLQGRVHA